MLTQERGDLFVGRNAEDKRGLLRLRYPMEHGTVTSWDDMERVWRYMFDCLGAQFTVKPEESPVLLTEAPLNPRKNRDIAAKIFFETYNVPAFFVSMQAVLSLYASGCTTGAVLDCGDGVTHAVPVCDGYAVTNAITRIDVAGRDVTNYLQLLLRRAGYNFHTSSEKEVVRTIKESKIMYVAHQYSKEEELEQKKEVDVRDFRLPDGSLIKICGERYRAPEVLFQPHLIGLEYMGVHECLINAIQGVDLDLRKSLYSGIFLAGGSTMFTSFGDRLLNEVRRIAPADATTIKIMAPAERKYTTWQGGSILASLESFAPMWITKKEYEEHGTNIVHRKTF
ncbi:centractin ARP1 [Acrasis kona]|uniref:Centractin ARP1 n=1 Tax=Acrasis kona TaxID=1008807 RepID=A0AAW2ZKF6_9EUKA